VLYLLCVFFLNYQRNLNFDLVYVYKRIRYRPFLCAIFTDEPYELQEDTQASFLCSLWNSNFENSFLAAFLFAILFTEIGRDFSNPISVTTCAVIRIRTISALLSHLELTKPWRKRRFCDKVMISKKRDSLVPKFSFRHFLSYFALSERNFILNKNIFPAAFVWMRLSVWYDICRLCDEKHFCPCIFTLSAILTGRRTSLPMFLCVAFFHFVDEIELSLRLFCFLAKKGEVFEWRAYEFRMSDRRSVRNSFFKERISTFCGVLYFCTHFCSTTRVVVPPLGKNEKFVCDCDGVFYIASSNVPLRVIIIILISTCYKFFSCLLFFLLDAQRLKEKCENVYNSFVFSSTVMVFLFWFRILATAKHVENYSNF